MFQDVEFDHGVHSFRKPDGSWNLWVRASPQGEHPRSTVRLRLDVATDERFSQIILSQQVNALQANSYIVRMNIRPIVTNNLLFFRFTVIDSADTKQRAATMSRNATSTRLPHSQTGKLDPWLDR
ncbi:PhoD-like phosphatase N-terminal domain-containing protein [Janthinobacterium sp. 551a]|uniref:PhoD-like phosphatase N-terminal domain-containing protein n=1 Tax=unclassified Janthinobacterium TaxID=2610881 RepID=UPI0034A156C9